MASEENEFNDRQAQTHAPGEGRTISMGPNSITFKVGGEETGGAFSMIEYSVAPGFQAPPAMHFHTHESWVGYILEGVFGFQLGDETVTLSAGSSLLVPKGLPFRWWNAEDKPAKYLAIYFPAGFEKYFDDIAALTKGLPPGPLDMSKLMPQLLPLWEKYGIKRVEE